ncbi:hypothetical protein SAMN04487895_108109 [Paenibacillus sophorae]|uniref:Uncharacterized protein n=1 Tax=Paenibacillus sophorae TaxID=1333845 RepID=A0A1H8Q896_9BACL|nr:hypothetical protein [Paenibacillus sophorae]QWU15234.1 hypothetical protein KP014_25670 [Paenibacillus sophorae]SEO50286.1 hypothetical protein SAMN04487895_108109 [Paenibacillus sophorae]
MDNKPKWVEQAGSGPFEKRGFTAEHAENVIRTIREGQSQAARERSRSPYTKTAVAVCITLTIAGLGWTAADGPLSGYRGTDNVSSSASRAVKEADMRNTADKAMQEMLGISLPLENAEHLPKKKLIRYSYRKGYNTAYIWISTETGTMVRAQVNSSLKPGEIEKKLSEGARVAMASLGYKGSFAYSASRYVNYDAAKDKTVAIRTTFRAADARVELINGNIVMMSFETDVGTIDPAMVEAGIKDLKIMNKNRGNPSLTGAYRVVKGTSDLLTLRFSGEASVTMDSLVRVVYGVSDRTLFDGKSDSPSAKAERDKQLRAVSEQKLRSAAEALTSAYGIHLSLADHQLKKSPETPGTATFTKPGGPDMTISYNISGAIWGFLFYDTK